MGFSKLFFQLFPQLAGKGRTFAFRRDGDGQRTPADHGGKNKTSRFRSDGGAEHNVPGLAVLVDPLIQLSLLDGADYHKSAFQVLLAIAFLQPGNPAQPRPFTDAGDHPGAYHYDRGATLQQLADSAGSRLTASDHYTFFAA